MNDLHWNTSSFNLHSTSRPLKWAIVLISIAIVGFFIFSLLYKTERTVVADGEVGTLEGEKLVLSPRDGNIKELNLKVGDKILKDQVIAQLQIPFTDEKSVFEVMNQIKLQNEILQKHKDNLSDLEFPKWKDVKSENPNLSKLISEAESTWEKYKYADRSLKLLAKKQLQNGLIQKRKLQVKLNSLVKSSQRKLMASLIDEIEEKIQKLETDQIGIQEEARAKLALARTDALNSLKHLSLQILEFYESYQIKSYCEGVVAKKMINSFQYISKNQTVVSIVPAGGNYVAVLKVASSRVGKVELKQNVKLAVDSFPYERFGYFEGQVESIDQSISNESNSDGAFIVRTTLNSPKQNNREIASQLRVLPGMKIKAYIETRKLTLFRIMYEKIFTSETQ